MGFFHLTVSNSLILYRPLITHIGEFPGYELDRFMENLSNQNLWVPTYSLCIFWSRKVFEGVQNYVWSYFEKASLVHFFSFRNFWSLVKRQVWSIGVNLYVEIVFRNSKILHFLGVTSEIYLYVFGIRFSGFDFGIFVFQTAWTKAKNNLLLEMMTEHTM